MLKFANGEVDPSGGMFPPWEAHPATVHFPIAFLLGAVALDLYAWSRGRTDLAYAATWLIAAGAISGLLAMATGLLAFFTVRAHTALAHEQMYWHLGLNAVAIVLFAAIFFLRRRPAGVGTGVRIAGLLAAALIAVSGFLGGQIVYRGGAGIDPAVLIPEIGGSGTPMSLPPGGMQMPAPKSLHGH
ncbi:MAG: DUF2231 domain-containing protein [Gemmataceae bacterium]|nr:DUF2231 domain-containing protein [Gemmataceae bacterium]